MADLDLLVSKADAAHAAQLLTELGFHPGHLTWKHQAFEPDDGATDPAPFGQQSDNPIRIELHSCIREILPLRPVDITGLMWPGAPGPGSTTTLRAARCCCISCCTPPARSSGARRGCCTCMTSRA